MSEQPWTDEQLVTFAQQIVQRRGKYRYAYTDERALKVVLDVLLDFREEVARERSEHLSPPSSEEDGPGKPSSLPLDREPLT